MTVLSPPSDSAEVVARSARWRYTGTGAGGLRPAEIAEYASVALVVVVLAVWITPAQGGIDDRRLPLGLLSLLPALVLSQSWKRIPGTELALALAVALSAWVVPLVAPTGWAGAEQVGGWAYGAGMFVVARAFARDRSRKHGAAGIVCVLALDQFSRAWLPWWGGRDPSRAMIGTFYWHNQFAAYVLAGAVAGFAFAVLASGRLRLLGWVVAPFCAVGVVLSTSRATMLELVAAAAAVLIISVLLKDRAAVARCGVLAVVSVALLFLLTSGVVFRDGGADPFAGTTGRAQTGQAIGTNAAYRLDFWRAGYESWLDRPATGSGFASFAATSAAHLPGGAVRSPAVHNGVIQAFTDGGVAHGVPVVVALLGAAVAVLGVVRRAVASRGDSIGLAVGGGLAAGAVILHGVIDFDWFFPSLIAIAAWCLAVGLPVPRSGEARIDAVLEPAVPSAERRRGAALARLIAVAAIVTLVVASAGAVRAHESLSLALATTDVLAESDRPAAARSIATAPNPLNDPRQWVAVLDYSVTIGADARRLAVPRGLVAEAVAGTARLAAIDPRVAVQRHLARYQLGDTAALAAVHGVVREQARSRPFLATPLARLLTAEGRPASAADVLREVLAANLDDPQPGLAGQVWELTSEIDRLPSASALYGCAYAEVAVAFGPAPTGVDVRFPGAPSAGVACDDLLGR